MKYLAHYYHKDEPYEELKRFAARGGLGFYKNRGQRRSPEQEYEHYLHYLTVKSEEHHAKTGRWLTASERERITREFYAPAYRAEMAKLAAETTRASRAKTNTTKQDQQAA